MFLNEEKKALEDLSEDEQVIIFKGFVAGSIEVFGSGAWRYLDMRCLFKESIYRVPPRKTKIDWSCINPELKYYAMDKDGERWFYAQKPEINDRTWSCASNVNVKGTFLLSEKVIQVGDEPWQESLIERPEGE